MQGEGRNESSRLGFRGVEDIGGGWGAGFWLEAAYAQDSGAGTTTTTNNTSVGQSGFLNGTSNTTASPTVAALGGTQGLTFNRAATVSLLNKGFGEVRVGRDYAPSFWNLTQFDPFGTVGAGAYTNIALGVLNPRNQVVAPGNPSPQVRTSNSIGWLSNDMNGLRAQVLMGLSEQLSTCSDLLTGTGPASNGCNGATDAGKHVGARLRYDSGPFAVAVGYGKTTYQNTTAAVKANAGSTAALQTYVGDYSAFNLAASYDLGVAKLMFQAGQNQYGGQVLDYQNYTPASAVAAAAAATKTGVLTVTPVTVNHNLIGATIPQGAMTWKVSYATASRSGGATTAVMTLGSYTNADIAENAKQTQFALGGVYDLSKRTALYGTWSSMKASGTNAYASQGVASSNATATADVTATTMDLGIRHRF